MSADNSAPAHALPSLDEVAAKLSGGTSSDPNIAPQGEATAAPEAAAAPEAVAEVKAPEKKEPAKDTSASRFAALTRKEREVRAREQAADRRVKEAEAKIAAANERDAAFSKIKQDPLAAMKAYGITYADITNAAVGSYKAPEEDPTDVKLKPYAERFDKFEGEASRLAKVVEELQNQLAAKEQNAKYNEVMDQIKTTAGDPEKYELINAMGEGAINLVRDTMVEYFNTHQKMLDYSEACDIVEQYYEDEFVGRLANTKKLKNRAQPATPQAAPKSAPPRREVKEPSATLTNKLSSAPEANVDIDKLPKHEALAYLAKKLQFVDK